MPQSVISSLKEPDVTVLANEPLQSTIGAANPPNSASSSGIRYVLTPVKSIPPPVSRLFLLFIFTFPFEATNLGSMTGSLSIAKIAGLLFFALYFLYYGPASAKRSFAPAPSAIWWFVGYVGVYVMSIARVPPDLFGAFLLRIFTLLQIVAFFWI